MPSIVDIDQAQTAIDIEPGGEATLSFDVANTAGRTLDLGLNTTSATGPAPPDWVSLADPPRLTLAPSETKRVVVTLAPGADAPPGETGFRLRVFERDLPEENVDRSDVVTVTVAPAGTTKRRPGWLIPAGLAAVALIVAGVLALVLWPSPGLPDFRDYRVAEARAQLGELGVGVEEVAVSAPDAEPGTVLGQEPAPGEAFEEGDVVRLEVAAFVMPDLVGRSLADADAALAALEQPVAVEMRETDDAAPDTVLAQRPEPGTVLPVPEAALTVAAEVALVEVPRIVGLQPRAAAERLGAQGLELGRQTGTRATGDFEEGAVVEQDPPAGASARPGGQVSFVAAVPVPRPDPGPRPVTFSTGPLEVPQTWTFDLDRGGVGGSGADLWFQAETMDQLFIAPRDGARIAVGDRSNRGFDGCGRASYSADRVPLGRIPVGSYVCVRTGEGRISQFRLNAVEGSGPRTLQIGYTTWR